MAAYGWRKDSPVARGLFEEGERFGFYQAVRLLEALMPERDRPAEGVDPDDELVRFRSKVRLDYPPSEIEELKPPRGSDQPAEMTVNVMGLTGPQGPLPGHVTELVLERSFRGDTAFRDFLDIFNHRLLAIFYRGRKKYRALLQALTPEESRVARTLYALDGLGSPGLDGRMEVADRALLPYTALLAPGPRSMVGLERMLGHYFGIGASVRPFVGRWLPLSEDQLTVVGEKAGRNNVLGGDAVLGRRVWEQQEAFEVELGPMDLATFTDMLPIGGAYRAACALIRFYVGEEHSFALRPTIAAEEVPELRLGSAGDSRLGWSARLDKRRLGGPGGEDSGAVAALEAEPRIGGAGGARLGWTSWLSTRKPEDDDSQVRLRARYYRTWIYEDDGATS